MISFKNYELSVFGKLLLKSLFNKLAEKKEIKNKNSILDKLRIKKNHDSKALSNLFLNSQFNFIALFVALTSATLGFEVPFILT